MKGRAIKQIWSGTAAIGSTITSSEFPNYNLFVIYTKNTAGLYDVPSIGIRNFDKNDIVFFGGTRTASNSYYCTVYGSLGHLSSTTSFKVGTNGMLVYNYDFARKAAQELSVVKVYGVL